MPRVNAKQMDQNARFVFQGTVRSVGNATLAGVPPSDKLLVVQVDEILKAPGTLGGLIGKEVTVDIGPGKPRLKVGHRATFYTNGWLFGESIAVRSLGHQLLPPQPVVATASAADAEAAAVSPDEALGQTDLQRRLADADAVVTGRVTAVRIPETEATTEAVVAAAGGGTEPVVPRISEHDPHWREAVIEVDATEKGDASGSRVVVRFASSDDVQWYRAPKFEPGQRGVFVLHGKRDFPQIGAMDAGAAPAEDVYTVLDPADFQPAHKLPVVQALIADQKNVIAERAQPTPKRVPKRRKI